MFNLGVKKEGMVADIHILSEQKWLPWNSAAHRATADSLMGFPRKSEAAGLKSEHCNQLMLEEEKHYASENSAYQQMLLLRASIKHIKFYKQTNNNKTLLPAAYSYNLNIKKLLFLTWKNLNF